MKIANLLTETPSAMMMQNIWKRMNRRKEIKQNMIIKLFPHLEYLLDKISNKKIMG